MDTSQFGSDRIGESEIIIDKLRDIPLGMVSHAVARVPSVGQIKEALRNQDKFTLLPRVEILLN